MEIEIKGITEASFLDWDGKVVVTLYLPLCNFRCPFCHNYRLFEEPESYTTRKLQEIFDYLDRHRDFIDGICITGGEPTLHAGLPELIKVFKDRGLPVKVDTNGSRPDVLRALIDRGLVDYVAMDIKAPLDERYARLSGVDFPIERIRESVEVLKDGRIRYEYRTTVVPELLGIKEIEEIAKSLEGAEKFALQQFVPKNSYSMELRELLPYEPEVLREMAETARKYVKKVVLRGI